MTDRPRIPPGRLEERFADKRPPLEATEALREADRCLYCWDAPCLKACPADVDVPTFIRKIATGNARGAARTILATNLLGASCARVCPVEVLCEGACVYVAQDRPPIPIGRLQRWAMEQGGGPEILRRSGSPSGRTVGLIGAGPASLACAGHLALLGHAPTIYEKRPRAGGLNVTGVAPYKMPAVDGLAEAEAILGLGVTVESGVEVGADVTAAELLARHDALFLGPGLGPDSHLGVPGEDGPGVGGAIGWIERMKLDPGAAVDGVRHAIVVGGGNTAVDAARELRGLGVPAVTIVYRRRADRMRAYAHEVAAARREGVVIRDQVAVAEIVRAEAGAVRSVRLVATENGSPTDRAHDPVPADLVLIAIGQAKLVQLAALFEGIACDERGRIVVDPATMATGHPRVFAGGDAVNGGREVVDAVRHGFLAARALDRRLRGNVLAPPPPLAPKSVGGPDSVPRPPGVRHA